MIELSLMTLLNTMAPRYCDYKRSGFDDTKATLLAFSDMHKEYRPDAIHRAVRDGKGLKTMAVAMVATTCPLDALKNNED